MYCSLYPTDWKKPGYLSTNGHVVRYYGRGFFVVTSRSRAGLDHFVDFEDNGRWPFWCQCESFKYNTRRPCRHMEACIECMIEPLELDEESLKKAVARASELIAMGFEFLDPIQEPEQQPETTTTKKRNYTIRPYETSQTTQRPGLPKGSNRKPAGDKRKERSGLHGRRRRPVAK